MKILLLGANGQVGFELARLLAPLGELICATRTGLLEYGERCISIDLAEPETLGNALHAVAPHVVVNAAAYTAVDRAEDEENLADRINHWALTVLGAWAAQTGALVVHYSTDYVFDGQGTRPYREDDATAPLGVYGRSKLAGENALRESGCEHLIFRTAWVYAARGQNFLRTMLRLAREREELRIVADQIGAPTPARWIAESTVAALARWHAAETDSRRALGGIYHLVAGGECSWCEFADAIVREAATRGLLDRMPRVVPITTDQYPTRARRPAYSLLDCSKLEQAFGLQLPNWREGLRAVLDEIAAHPVTTQA